MPDTRHDSGVLLLNFGEPSSWGLEEVEDFLERIFLANARLDPDLGPEAAKARARDLAERRAPALMSTYETIGGSPLAAQAAAQAEALAAALTRRGRTVPIEVGMQFTSPTIEDALLRLRARGPVRVAALPVYPLCGPSTTMAALSDVASTLEGIGWAPEVRGVSGWHRHPGYTRFRAGAIQDTAGRAGFDLSDAATRVVFSAHGTPMKYVEDGSRYVEYVEDWCSTQARELGLPTWTLGYQNHSNRGIEWTAPDIEDALSGLEGVERVVVDAVSFMHEQSETLMELDVDLAGHAAGLGLDYARVPIAHAAPGFIDVLADLVETALWEAPDGLPPLTPCRCYPGAAVCFNAGRAV